MSEHLYDFWLIDKALLNSGCVINLNYQIKVLNLHDMEIITRIYFAG